MINPMHTVRSIALVLLGFHTLVSAQAPASKDPHHTVAFENAQFRVLNVNVPSKTSTLEHKHELDNVTVSMMPTGADTRVQLAGQPWGPTRPPRLLGSVEINEFASKPVTHRIENVGASAFQLFAIENLKTTGWSTAPAVTAPLTKLARESRSFRAYTVSLGKQQTSHKHAVPTVVVLMSGKVMSDGPSAKAKQNAPAAVGLKQLVVPGEWVLVPEGDTHHLISLGNTDGQVVEIEVR
jgi:hypothetical protein